MPIPVITQNCKGLMCRSVAEAGRWERFVHQRMINRAGKYYEKIEPYLKGKVLDVGMGSGSFSCLLKQEGHEVDGVDVVDLSMYEDMKPVIYDGENLPFRNGEYDTALLMVVLHHCDVGE